MLLRPPVTWLTGGVDSPPVFEEVVQTDTLKKPKAIKALFTRLLFSAVNNSHNYRQKKCIFWILCFPGSLKVFVGFVPAPPHCPPQESHNEMWLYQREYRATVEKPVLSSSAQRDVDTQSCVVATWMSTVHTLSTTTCSLHVSCGDFLCWTVYQKRRRTVMTCVTLHSAFSSS